MVNLCCCCKKKIAPKPLPVEHTAEVIAPKIEPKEKPYGYVRLYPGVKTSENNYTSPVISLHTYTEAQKSITRTTTVGENGTHLGPSSSTNTSKQETDEKVRCVPVEDIISISYSIGIKKEYQTFETVQERARPPKAKLSCCGRIKECLDETFCRCSICPCKRCKPKRPESPKYDTNIRKNVKAHRVILIEMKCIRHTNIHIPSHVEVLPTDKKIEFLKENFLIDTIEFYLVNNTETEEEDFKIKQQKAEELCRVIVQLRNMVNHYPSPRELKEILQQEDVALYGDDIHA